MKDVLIAINFQLNYARGKNEIQTYENMNP